jgi:hypothetical protein
VIRNTKYIFIAYTQFYSCVDASLDTSATSLFTPSSEKKTSLRPLQALEDGCWYPSSNVRRDVPWRIISARQSLPVSALILARHALYAHFIICNYREPGTERRSCQLPSDRLGARATNDCGAGLIVIYHPGL